MNLNVGDNLTDPGYSATDTEDGTITGSVTTSGRLISVAGTYEITYNVVDSKCSRVVTKVRTVVVHTASTNNNPVITLTGIVD